VAPHPAPQGHRRNHRDHTDTRPQQLFQIETGITASYGYHWNALIDEHLQGLFDTSRKQWHIRPEGAICQLAGPP
jgi:hypothetical protein